MENISWKDFRRRRFLYLRRISFCKWVALTELYISVYRYILQYVHMISYPRIQRITIFQEEITFRIESTEWMIVIHYYMLPFLCFHSGINHKGHKAHKKSTQIFSIHWCMKNHLFSLIYFPHSQATKVRCSMNNEWLSSGVMKIKLQFLFIHLFPIGRSWEQLSSLFERKS